MTACPSASSSCSGANEGSCAFRRHSGRHGPSGPVARVQYRPGPDAASRAGRPADAGEKVPRAGGAEPGYPAFGVTNPSTDPWIVNVEPSGAVIEP